MQRLYIRRILLVVAGIFVLVACGEPAVVTPAVETVVTVEVTRIVEVTREVEVTRIAKPEEFTSRLSDTFMPLVMEHGVE